MIRNLLRRAFPTNEVKILSRREHDGYYYGLQLAEKGYRLQRQGLPRRIQREEAKRIVDSYIAELEHETTRLRESGSLSSGRLSQVLEIYMMRAGRLKEGFM